MYIVCIFRCVYNYIYRYIYGWCVSSYVTLLVVLYSRYYVYFLTILFCCCRMHLHALYIYICIYIDVCIYIFMYIFNDKAIASVVISSVKHTEKNAFVNFLTYIYMYICIGFFLLVYMFIFVSCCCRKIEKWPNTYIRKCSFALFHNYNFFF